LVKQYEVHFCKLNTKLKEKGVGLEAVRRRGHFSSSSLNYLSLLVRQTHIKSITFKGRRV
jgi:lambda repressor-like predicted transcriptional regulator